MESRKDGELNTVNFFISDYENAVVKGEDFLATLEENKKLHMAMSKEDRENALNHPKTSDLIERLKSVLNKIDS